MLAHAASMLTHNEATMTILSDHRRPRHHQTEGQAMQWKRHGREWILYHGKRRMGRVVPDSIYPKMFRSIMPDGSLSDMANLTWAKDAVLASAEREISYGLQMAA
jgi:hypothetical protein